MKVFKRVIATDKYRAEIDGLRFIAILAVLLFHVDGFLTLYTDKSSFLSPVWFTGHLGVQLFFSISGFVLMSQILRSKNFSYKKYLIRRIERIEPPFLLTTIIFYLLLSFRDGFDEAKNNSLFHVLTYTSNFNENLINFVTWSLEIEVVFYLLLPLFFYIFKDDLKKWLLFGVLIFAFSRFYELHFLTSHFHWFIVGISVAIIEKNNIQVPFLNLGKYITLLSLLSYFALDIFDKNSFITLLQIALLFVFLYGVLIKGQFKKTLSIEILTIIGGACYIIYLIHFQVISVVGHQLIPLIKNRELIVPILLIITLMVCLLAFPILERPFMKRKWWAINK
ncbi:acyltransferase [Aurantibacter sp.]|uniref:acyltransferase family protein n=1 Tax=Aurantibacter sp. TaxID=2807103 RepID=UPI0032663D2C